MHIYLLLIYEPVCGSYVYINMDISGLTLAIITTGTH